MANRFDGVFGNEPLTLPDGNPEDEEIVPGDEKSLSDSERRALEQCEQIIERGLKTFIQVGRALTRIRDAKLYRLEYRTFEDYCAERWGIERGRAYQIMSAATVAENVRNFRREDPPDIIESHAKELGKLKEPEQQWEAWQRANEQAEQENTKVTAKLISSTVQELIGKSPSQPAQLPAPTGEPADLVKVRVEVEKGKSWIPLRQLFEIFGTKLGNEKADHDENKPTERAYTQIRLQNIRAFVNSFRRISIALEEYDEVIQKERGKKAPSPLITPLDEIAAALEQMREDMVE